MNKILRLTILIIFFLLCSHINAGDQTEQILMVGIFHGDEVSAVDGEEWDVLYSRDGSFFLEKAQIKIELVEDVIIDNKGEKTGKKVSVDIEGEPVLLLKNISNITPGEVSTSINSKIYFFENDSIKAETAYDDYLIGMNIIDSKADLFISDGTVNQTLKEFTAYLTGDSYYMFGDEAMPSLIWAGDLDGDNKLDLLLDMTDHYNVSEVSLFLSSHASKGKLAKKVAVFRTAGC